MRKYQVKLYDKDLTLKSTVDYRNNIRFSNSMNGGQSNITLQVPADLDCIGYDVVKIFVYKNKTEKLIYTGMIIEEELVYRKGISYKMLSIVPISFYLDTTYFTFTSFESPYTTFPYNYTSSGFISISEGTTSYGMNVYATPENYVRNFVNNGVYPDTSIGGTPTRVLISDYDVQSALTFGYAPLSIDNTPPRTVFDKLAQDRDCRYYLGADGIFKLKLSSNGTVNNTTHKLNYGTDVSEVKLIKDYKDLKNTATVYRAALGGSPQTYTDTTSQTLYGTQRYREYQVGYSTGDALTRATNIVNQKKDHISNVEITVSGEYDYENIEIGDYIIVTNVVDELKSNIINRRIVKMDFTDNSCIITLGQKYTLGATISGLL